MKKKVTKSKAKSTKASKSKYTRRVKAKPVPVDGLADRTIKNVVVLDSSSAVVGETSSNEGEQSPENTKMVDSSGVRVFDHYANTRHLQIGLAAVLVAAIITLLVVL